MLKFEGPAPPKSRNIVSRKMQFGWVQTHIQFSVVCGPKFTGLSSWNVGGIGSEQFFPILDILSRSGYIRDQILKLSEIAPNFACFSPPISLGGGSPEFLDLHYKAHPYCDHVAKFRGDRPSELGDRVAKKIKKTSAVKHKAFRTNVRAA